MKLFLDTANAAAIKQWADTGLIDGVTTNPSWLSKEGGDPKKVIEQTITTLQQAYISMRGSIE